jgi:transcriptional/translational regulatory protein YebC/TACO1
MELGLEAGAEDVDVDGEFVTFMAAPQDFLSVKTALEEAGIAFVEADTGHVPQNTVDVESKDEAKKVLRLVDTLEDNDDVQNVYSNFNIPDEWIEELTS